MPPRKPWIILLISTVILVVGTSLYVSGSPIRARQERFDTQRTNDLQQITYAIDSFWNINRRLPTSLDELVSKANNTTLSYYVGSINDPKTFTPYEYRPLEHSQPSNNPTQPADEPRTYELCATFETSTEAPKHPRQPQDTLIGYHPSGHHCLTTTVRTLNTPPIK